MNPVNLNKIIGKNIKKYRKIKKRNINELSKLTKIPISIIESIENYTIEREITIDELYKISVVLDIAINKLLENKDDQ